MATIKKTAILITIITIGSKLLGFGREILLAYFYGTSYIVDSYLMAISIPSMLFGWINSVGVSYTPIYSEIRAIYDEEKSVKFTNNLITLIFIIAIFLTILGITFSKQIVSIAAPGFKGETYYLTIDFLKISMFTIIFTSIIQILIAFLNCNYKFIHSNIANLVISSTQMLFIFFSGKGGDKILIYGVLISHVLQLIILYFLSKRNELNYKFELDISSEVKRAFLVAGPIFISSMILQISIFVDKMFASKLNEGSISALNYSANIQQFIFYVFSVAIITMIYPILSNSIAENNLLKVKSIFSKAINFIIILFVPITIGAVILSKPAIEFVYERGEFGQESTIMTATALIMYSLGLLPLAIREVITKVFYSMQDTKSAMYISIVAVLVDIILNILLIKPFAHNGLALATSLSAILSLPLYFLVLRKKIGNIGLKNSLLVLLKSFLSGLIMAFVVINIFNYCSAIFNGGKLFDLLNIMITVIVGGIIYFFSMMFMKVNEMKFFTDIINDVFRKIIRIKYK